MSGKLIRYALPLLIALPVGFLLLYPQLVRCLRVDQSADFQVLTGMNEVYISQTATPKQRGQLRHHVRTATDRIRRFWGDRRGHAILIYCPLQADYEHYCLGGEGAGCSLGTPWGASYLVLGPEGNNTDVIAHELCHDELFSRLGWWTVKRQIPQWFNEGLALMVDYRFSSPAVWERPTKASRADSLFDSEPVLSFPRQPMLTLSDLETTRDFFGGSYSHVMQAYQTSADEVARWLSIVGQPGVPALTNAMENGDDFRHTYQQLERTKRLRKRSRK
ncbi:hypothetical protein [Spirosoma agri]|uniref:DUF1570 domain-containing protein n=1 Tax=Spirosoma agri TaxID=1987381 RepID=A0A6M0IG26_9BACT|nr:hypothetical protein [Spirosoma agri]NEU67240.1 hypothetical protein [Spirosoma agri]